jgi:peptidyl-prolyl cis-trans isomerase SurA
MASRFRSIRLAAFASLAASLAASLTVSAPRVAEAAIVERVVAVVGERPILLSELRLRARPHLYRIAMATQNPTQQAAQESEMFRELLNRMIDERLEEQAADKAHVTVTPEEVDNGIKQVAAQAKMTPKDLVAEAKRQGLTEQDYRDEIRRQVLEGKLIQLRVRGRVRVTDQDARAAYGHLVKEIQGQAPVDLRILALAIPPGAPQSQVDTRRVLGQELANRAKRGEDFCQLVLNYSDDPTTKPSCGSRGPIPLSSLYGDLQAAARNLQPGETADPIFFRDPMGSQAILVVQLATAQPKIPAFAEVQDQMMERAFVEATERQRKLWLQELRRGLYIDVRL